MRKSLILIVSLIFVFGFGVTLSISQEEVKDPVCGMKIKASEAKFKSEYKGKTYYFCSSDCKAKFEKEPEKYAVKGEAKEHKPMPICCSLSQEIMKDVRIEKKETEKGLTLVLTSSNPEVAQKLQENIGKCKMAHGEMEHGGMKHEEMSHTEMKHEECCMMHMKDVKSSVTNIKDGVRIELTSENLEVVKKMKSMCKKSSCCGKEEHKH